MGGTNTGPTVLNWFVCEREFSQVVSNHFGLDFNLAKILAVVYTSGGSSHLGNNDHVSQVCLDDFWLLIWWSLFLGLPQLLDQGHWLAFQTTGEPPASTTVHQFDKLVAVHNSLRLDSCLK